MPCPELLDSHFPKIGLAAGAQELGGRLGARRQPRRISTTKDSVMVVTKDEYEKCRSAHPIFFSNNGVTAFTLHRTGLFYFISGVSGHCERGQKMIIKVLESASPPEEYRSSARSGQQIEVGLPGRSIPAKICSIRLLPTKTNTVEDISLGEY
ncbi:unnamed protein product [Prunus armeniaca]